MNLHTGKYLGMLHRSVNFGDAGPPKPQVAVLMRHAFLGDP